MQDGTLFPTQTSLWKTRVFYSIHNPCLLIVGGACGVADCVSQPLNQTQCLPSWTYKLKEHKPNPPQCEDTTKYTLLKERRGEISKGPTNHPPEQPKMKSPFQILFNRIKCKISLLSYINPGTRFVMQAAALDVLYFLKGAY